MAMKVVFFSPYLFDSSSTHFWSSSFLCFSGLLPTSFPGPCISYFLFFNSIFQHVPIQHRCFPEFRVWGNIYWKPPEKLGFRRNVSLLTLNNVHANVPKARTVTLSGPADYDPATLQARWTATPSPMIMAVTSSPFVQLSSRSRWSPTRTRTASP